MKDELSQPIDEEIPPEWFLEIQERALEGNKNDTRRIEIAQPRKAARVLWMLAQGISKTEIARQTGMNRWQVQKLAFRHSDTLETKRKEFSREFAMVAMEYKNLLLTKSAQLEDDPDQLKAISPDKLALTMAICTDKAAMLSGMAGIVIEHRKGASIDDAIKFREEVRARIATKMKNDAIEAEVIDE